MYHCNRDENILVVELHGRAEDLRNYHRRLGRFPRWVARQLGALFAEIHATPVPHTDALSGRRLVSPEPPGIYLHRPGLTVLDDLSAAGLEIIRLVQQFPDIGAQLDDLREGWRPAAFIHQDARWDNVLVARSPGGRHMLKIVDWESAGLGDPAWDIGALLGDYLGFWIGSIPLNGQAAPDRYLQHAAYPIARMQPAIGTLWQTYRQAAASTLGDAESFLLRVTRYAGLKLMQTALEHVQDMPECDMTAVCLLQVGVNMLQRPRDAAGIILGLSVEDGAC